MAWCGRQHRADAEGDVDATFGTRGWKTEQERTLTEPVGRFGEARFSRFERADGKRTTEAFAGTSSGGGVDAAVGGLRIWTQKPPAMAPG